MERFKKFFLLAASLGLLVVVVTVLGTKEVHALVATMVDEVRNEENPARHPFQQTVEIDVNGGFGNAFGQIAVPSGMELVVESVSTFATPGIGTQVADYVIQPNGLNTMPEIFFVPSPLPASNDQFSNEQVRMYSAPGTSMEVSVRLTGAGSSVTITHVTVVGYLVPIP